MSTERFHSGGAAGEIPRGVEVLVSKASVDAEFKALLLERRAEAAQEIGLALSPTEAMMLDAIPEAHLDAVIARTKVAPANRRAFLGTAAVVMLAALGAGARQKDARGGSLGIRPIQPPRDTKHIVYVESDFRQTPSFTYGITDPKGFGDQRDEIARMNRLLPRAVDLSRRAWYKNLDRNGVRFPLKSPRHFRIKSLGAYTREAEAQTFMREGETANAKRLEGLALRAKVRLSALDEADRTKAIAKQKALQEAEQLLEDTLRSLLAEKKPVPPHSFTRGIRPDRPPPTQGVRPDRP